MAKQNEVGKLAAERLTDLLSRYGAKEGGPVLVGPRVGLDAAAVAVDKGILVLASDPVTYATEELGSYVVHINANDVFASGAEPKWFVADILVPPGQDELVEKIFQQIHQACSQLGILIVGGHTEITPDLVKPIVAGFMVGQTIGKRVVNAAGVQAGDAIVLTKAVAIEGTAIIAQEYEERLVKKRKATVAPRAKRFLIDPGISVANEARIALDHCVHAMHDPTEGGLLNGLWEMSHASGYALHIEVDKVPVYPETKAVCGCFGIDPYRLLASGALLISCSKVSVKDLLKALRVSNIAASEIGYATEGPCGVHLKGAESITEPVTDEILKVFSQESGKAAGKSPK